MKNVIACADAPAVTPLTADPMKRAAQHETILAALDHHLYILVITFALRFTFGNVCPITLKSLLNESGLLGFLKTFQNLLRLRCSPVSKTRRRLMDNLLANQSCCILGGHLQQLIQQLLMPEA